MSDQRIDSSPNVFEGIFRRAQLLDNAFEAAFGTFRFQLQASNRNGVWLFFKTNQRLSHPAQDSRQESQMTLFRGR